MWPQYVIVDGVDYKSNPKHFHSYIRQRVLDHLTILVNTRSRKFWVTDFSMWRVDREVLGPGNFKYTYTLELIMTRK